MKISYLFSIAILCLCSFFSCKNEKARQALSADIFIRYTQDDGRIKSEVRFRDEATTLQALLDPPTINGEVMRKVSNQEVYVFSKLMGLPKIHKIDWTDLDGKKYAYPFEAKSIVNFSFSEKKLARNKTADLQWDGAPLGKNEILLLFWEKDGQVVKHEANGPSKTNALQIPMSQLQQLTPGAWSLYLIRKQQIQAKAGLNASVAYEFYSSTKTFELY